LNAFLLIRIPFISITGIFITCFYLKFWDVYGFSTIFIPFTKGTSLLKNILNISAISFGFIIWTELLSAFCFIITFICLTFIRICELVALSYLITRSAEKTRSTKWLVFTCISSFGVRACVSSSIFACSPSIIGLAILSKARFQDTPSFTWYIVRATCKAIAFLSIPSTVVIRVKVITNCFIIII